MNQNNFLLLFFLSVLWTFSGHGQNEDIISKKIEALKSNIKQSEGLQKLVWMDSLSNTIVFDTNFDNDSIVAATVKFAIELDSFGIATWHTAKLITYQNNRVGNPKAGNKLFVDFLETAKKTNFHHALANYYLEGADSYYFIEELDTSVLYYDLAEFHAKECKNTRLEGLAKLYKGASLSSLGEFAKASQTLQEASTIFEKVQDTFNIIGTKNSLSILYSQNAFYNEAAEERAEAIVMAQAIQSYQHLTSFYFNASIDNRKQGLYTLQIENIKQAIKANEKTESKDIYIPMIYSSLVVAYANQGNIIEAEKWYTKLEKETTQTAKDNNIGDYLAARKALSFAKQKYRDAAAYGEEHLTIIKNGDLYEERLDAEKFLSNVYEKLGNTERAYKHYKTFSAISDSISSIQKIKGLSYYQTLYETEKRDLTISNQKRDIALLDAKSKIQNQWMIFGSIGFLSLFGVVLLVRSRNAAKNHQKLQEKFSQNLLQAQELERNRIAKELHDSVGQQLTLIKRKAQNENQPQISDLTNTTLEEVRSISRGLYPANLKLLGLKASIEQLMDLLDEENEAFFSVDIEDINDFFNEVETLHFYRFIQEAINNVLKHSEAKTVSLTITKNKNSIKTTIEDNGKGFDSAEKINQQSLGLKTMNERIKLLKGKLSITSTINNGAKLIAETPIL